MGFNSKHMLYIAGVVFTIFGLMQIIIPAQMMDTFGVTYTSESLGVLGLFGATNLGLATICFLSAPKRYNKELFSGLLVFSVLGATMALIWNLRADLSPGSWMSVVNHTLLAIGFAYCRFSPSAGSSPGPATPTPA